MKQLLQLMVVVVFLLPSLKLKSQEQDGPISPTILGTGVYHGLTPPLKDMPTISKEEWHEMLAKGEQKVLNKKLKDREYPFQATALPKGPDEAWQKQMGTTETTKAPILNFSGQTSPYTPPDCNGTVGRSHFMQTINCVYAIYNNSTGALVAGPTNMNNLFSGMTGATCNDGDPLVLYDEQADRWLAVEFSICGSNDYMLVAVSQTNNPTGSWHKYSFDVADMPDYEKFGIWQDGYYMGTNNSSGNDIYVFQRSQMLSGLTAQFVGFNNAWRPSTIDGFMCVPPVDNDGAFAPEGSPGLFITINDDAIGGGSDQLWIYELDVNWTTPASSTFNRVQQINVTAFDSNFGNNWDNIKQPNSQELDAIPQVIMNIPQYRNFGTYQTIVCCHTVDVDLTDHAGIRWYELRKTTGTWSVRQTGTYAPDANSRWMGSIALNGLNEIGLGYSISSTTVYPGIRYCGQSASAYATGAGVLDVAEAAIQTATTAQSSYNRWGDYSAISIDPDDDHTFWFTTQYGGSRQTKIASFQFTPPSLTANFSGTPTSVCAGGTVTFTDQSVGGPTSWSWSFPGGTPSSYIGSTPPAISYSTPGTYDVTLTVTNATSNDSEIKTGYITVHSVIADFSGSPTTVNAGSTVAFTDLSSCSPTSWSWSFPGGTPSTASGQGPHIVTYNSQGNYDVSLSVSNVNGSDTETKTGYITVSAPSYNMANGNITTCSGSFYDSGGPSGNYANNSNLTETFYPATPGAMMRCIFNSFTTQSGNDILRIYDGINTSATLLGSFSGTSNPGTFTATNGSGALTFNFTSNASTRMAGWDATLSCYSSMTPPVANFSANNTTPYIGQTVTFTDLSTNSPTLWSWSFSPATVTYVGGTTSASQNPQVQFNAGGLYSVTLIATNGGGSDPETKNDYISVFYAPVANFSASTTTPAVGQTVTFSDQSTNSPTSWAWSFSPTTVTYVGGTTSASQHPQVQFNTGGFYTVTLTASNASGSDGETKSNYINVPSAPVADFDADFYTPIIGQPIFFWDMSLNNPTSWDWSFSPSTVSYAGGTNSNSQEPQVIFNAGGSYTVSLIATNAGGSDTETKVNFINVPNPPVANFSASTTTPIIGQTITFTDLSTNSPTSWTWSFSPATVTFTGGTNSTSQNPQVQFTFGGLYTVTLTATNTSGNDSEVKTNYISVLYLPEADFSASTTISNVGQTVTLTDLSTNTPTAWAWSFSPATVTYVGGTNSSSQNPQIQFTAGGLYSATLTATNASGSDEETKTDYISVTAPPVTNFSSSTTTPNVGQTVIFSDFSTNTPTSWLWAFIPGTVSYVGGTSASSQNPELQFDSGGLYTVTLTATNSAGSDDETKIDYIFVTAPPVADFSADNTTPGVGQTVNFTDQSINGPTLWTWTFTPSTVTFVGGTNAMSQHLQIYFDAAGTYTVDLTVSNVAGSNIETKTDYISVTAPPVAGFTADNTNPNLGSSVNFSDLSTNNPTTWSWIFIPTTITYLGGTSSATQNPQVQFDATGYYIVELTVTNAGGSDTETKTDYIYVQNPIIDLDITVYLEGPFNGTGMTPNLNGILPLSQPYNIAPWNYTGIESVGAIPDANVVDWVLVELRDATDAGNATSAALMDRKAAFLLNNGKVVDMDGTSTLQFTNSLTQQLFVVIWHRNHLGVMTSDMVTESGGIYSYNFTTGAAQAYGSTAAHKQISPGVWGMIGGDGDKDGQISPTDKSPLWDTQSGTQGYLESDYNLDAQSDNKDKDDIWAPNLGAGSQVLD